MTQEDKKYTRVGIFTTGAIILFFVGYQFISKGGLFDNSTTLYSFANDVSGISTETPIVINGFQIGKVSDLSLKDGNVLIEFSVDKKIKLTKSAQFFSSPNGMFGDRQIEVQNVNEGEDFYKSGDTIQTEFITNPIGEIIDSSLMKEIEPTLKEFSKTLGKALQDYGEEDNATNSKNEEN